MKYLTQKIKNKNKPLRENNFTKISQTNGEETSGNNYEPKRILNEEAKDNEKLQPGDRIVHKKKVSGRNIYNDPDFWESK